MRVNEKGQQENFCTHCKTFKTFDAFNKDRTTKNNFATRCRECIKSKKSYQESLQRRKDKAIESNKILNQSVIENGKVCLHCDTTKPHTGFEKSIKFKDGFSKRCNDCLIKRKKELNKKHGIKRYERIMNDPIKKSKKNARRMISSAFRYVGSKKNSKTFEIIGLDANNFEQWLRDVSDVKPETHQVHIDHVIPISSAQSHDDVLALSHFSNLQWLSHDQNIRKRNLIIKQCDLFRVLEFTPYKNIIEKIINQNDFKIIGSKQNY